MYVSNTNLYTSEQRASHYYTTNKELSYETDIRNQALGRLD